MPCAEFHPLLSELVDGALAGEPRAETDAHLLECADCRQLLADLRRVREAGRAFPRVTAPVSAWPRLRDAVARDGAAPGRPRRGWTISAGWPAWGALAAAAAIVVAVGTAIFFAVRPAPPAPTQAASPAAPPSAEAEIEAAQLHYARAIQALQQAANEGRAALDPQTMAVLDKNNSVLDQAIQDSQAVVRAHPTSEFAQSSLLDALQRKVNLLRDTLALINEMRKGDQAGTARIVGSMGKS